jgi:hypothetical protein
MAGADPQLRSAGGGAQRGGIVASSTDVRRAKEAVSQNVACRKIKTPERKPLRCFLFLIAGWMRRSLMAFGVGLS